MKASCVYTIDMGGTFLKGAVVNSNKEIVGNIITIEADSSKEFDTIKNQYKKMIDSFNKIALDNNLEAKALSISSPGPFDYYNGISHMEHKYQAIYKKNLKELFKNEFNLNMDIIFENDIIAYLNGELAMLKDCYKNVCGITIGTGLGFAIKENGAIKRNEFGSPSIILWNKKYLDGISEDYISGRGLVRIYKEIAKQDIENGLEVYKLAKNNDLNALEAFKIFGQHLVNVIKPTLVEHNIDLLLIGGQVAKSNEFFKDILEANLPNVKIFFTNNSNSTLIGLASLI